MCEEVQTCYVQKAVHLMAVQFYRLPIQCSNAAIVDVGAHFICKDQVRISADVLTVLIDISLNFPEFLPANALKQARSLRSTSFSVCCSLIVQSFHAKFFELLIAL